MGKKAKREELKKGVIWQQLVDWTIASWEEMQQLESEEHYMKKSFVRTKMYVLKNTDVL